MILSIPQILTLAAGAGFAGADLATAAAVALAETDPPGNSLGPYNPELKAGAAPGQGSYGLWQIYLTAHPQFDPSQLTNDPQYNAGAAYQVYAAAGASFRPWTTYNSGKYLSFLPQVQAAIAARSPAPGTDQTAAAPATDAGGNGTADGTAAPIDLTNFWPVALIGFEVLLWLSSR